MNTDTRKSRSLKRLVSHRWVNCSKDYQELETFNAPDAIIYLRAGRWHVAIGVGNDAKWHKVSEHSTRRAAERAAIATVKDAVAVADAAKVANSRSSVTPHETRKETK